MKIQLYNDDCLNAMKNIPDASIDLILTDLPYGFTDCKWDIIIPFDKMWEEFKRVLKKGGTVALFGDNGLFTAKLILSNEKWFKYNWVWKKHRGVGFLNCKYQPLRDIESISIFQNPDAKKDEKIYNPQMGKGKPYHKSEYKILKSDSVYKQKIRTECNNEGTRYPTQVLEFKSLSRTVHPTQKPVDLLEYLIKTYTDEGMTVLDATMGSGSTMVACINTNRNGIGIELDNDYFNISKTRIEEAKNDLQ